LVRSANEQRKLSRNLFKIIKMKIFKFGGASVKDAEEVKNM
jgi:aspartokinase